MSRVKKDLSWVTYLSWKALLGQSVLFGSLEHGRFHADFQENKVNHETLKIILPWFCWNDSNCFWRCTWETEMGSGVPGFCPVQWVMGMGGTSAASLSASGLLSLSGQALPVCFFSRRQNTYCLLQNLKVNNTPSMIFFLNFERL
jgi:hypothetical protein